MEFGTVLFLVVLTALPIAAVAFAGAFGLLDDLGKGGMAIDDAPLAPAPPPHTPAGRMEREEEIRQLVQARHDRELARGKAPIDVDEEVGRLLSLGAGGESPHERHDSALREEVRQLVIARNERRHARGEPPLDVDREVERQLRDLA